MLANPEYAVCAPCDSPTAALSFATDGVASNAAVNVPLCDGNAVLFQVAFAVVVVQTTGCVTVSPAVVLWLRLPLVPVIVTVEFPAAAVLLALIVSEQDPGAVAVHGIAVTPAGKLLALTLTLPLNPFTGVTVAV